MACLQDPKAPFGMSTRLPHQAAWQAVDAPAGTLMMQPMEVSMADAYTYNVGRHGGVAGWHSPHA